MHKLRATVTLALTLLPLALLPRVAAMGVVGLAAQTAVRAARAVEADQTFLHRVRAALATLTATMVAMVSTVALCLSAVAAAALALSVLMQHSLAHRATVALAARAISVSQRRRAPTLVAVVPPQRTRHQAVMRVRAAAVLEVRGLAVLAGFPTRAAVAVAPAAATAPLERQAMVPRALSSSDTRWPHNG